MLLRYGVQYHPQNIQLYITSMTHLSYALPDASCEKMQVPYQKESYERLEFLGDAIIHAIYAEYIFNRYHEQEGFMTKLRTQLEKSDTLCKFTTILGLDRYILLSRHMEETGSRQNNKHLLEDVFEAFIGALYTDKLDGNNYNVCRQFIYAMIEKEVDIAEIIHNDTNYKDTLLQYAHTQKWKDPIYGTMSVKGTDFKKYEMSVTINGVIHGTGRGNSKKHGEQMAAMNALKKLHALRVDSDYTDDEYTFEP
jgi:dsRNA-specific ribonuclease